MEELEVREAWGPRWAPKLVGILNAEQDDVAKLQGALSHLWHGCAGQESRAAAIEAGAVPAATMLLSTRQPEPIAAAAALLCARLLTLMPGRWAAASAGTVDLLATQLARAGPAADSANEALAVLAGVQDGARMLNQAGPTRALVAAMDHCPAAAATLAAFSQWAVRHSQTALEAGGIEALVPQLARAAREGNADAMAYMAQLLRTLCHDDHAKHLAVDAGVVPAAVAVMQHGQPVAVQAATGLVASLCAVQHSALMAFAETGPDGVAALCAALQSPEPHVRTNAKLAVQHLSAHPELCNALSACMLEAGAARLFAQVFGTLACPQLAAALQSGSAVARSTAAKALHELVTADVQHAAVLATTLHMLPALLAAVLDKSLPEDARAAGLDTLVATLQKHRGAIESLAPAWRDSDHLLEQARALPNFAQLEAVFA